MKKRIILITASLLLITLLFLSTACVPKKTTNPITTPATTDQLQSRVASLESKLASQTELVTILRNQLQALPAQQNWQPTTDQIRSELNTARNELATLKTENANLKTQNADLTAKIVKIEARLVALEKPTGTGQTTDTATRWDVDISTQYPETQYAIAYSVKPSRIEFDGDYTIYLRIANTDNTTRSDVKATITFVPETGDRIFIDATKTDIETVSSPYTWWDLEVVERSDKSTRRIVAISDKIKVNANGEITLRLDFFLVYK